MLEELHVSALGVVDDVTLELAPGLNVLTGETGAGKTMITVGLALALGARASPSMVRAGRRGLAVEARFGLPADAQHDLLGPADVDGWLEDDDGGDGHRELVLARTVSAEGRSSARVGGRLAPVSSLASIGARLVQVHGQHDAQRLLAAAAQTEFLDRFAGGGHLGTLGRYRAVHGELRRARRMLEELGREAREREREKDLLRYQIREIEAAMLRPGEIASLVDQESRLAHADRIQALAAGAESVMGDEAGAADRLREAAAAVRSAAALDRAAGDLADRLTAAVAEAEDLVAELRAYREGLDVDPARLAAVQERLQAVRALERKYGDGEEGILGYLEDARRRLETLEGSDAEVESLEQRARELAAEHDRLASAVSASREAAAPPLAAALTAEVRELGMPGAAVEVRLAKGQEPGADGAERAELWFSGGPGQALLPLARSASGGELSRVMLACRSVLAGLDDVPTLVFDEIDVGIGGRTAAAVADRLVRVARGRQVLVVTHLAQIAARADRHLVVAKDEGAATVRPVEGEERVEEVARMLAGSTGEVSVAHARELIASREGRGRRGGEREAPVRAPGRLAGTGR